MDPHSGKTYTAVQSSYLPTAIAERLVSVEGHTEDVERIATAVKHYADATSRDRDRRRTARKTAKASRRKNRT